MFLLIWWFSSKPRPRMAVTGLFTAGYGISRFFIEFFRQPDAGYELIFGWMSKGQLYCIPMIVIGLGFNRWRIGNRFMIGDGFSKN